MELARGAIGEAAFLRHWKLSRKPKQLSVEGVSDDDFCLACFCRKGGDAIVEAGKPSGDPGQMGLVRIGLPQFQWHIEELAVILGVAASRSELAENAHGHDGDIFYLDETTLKSVTSRLLRRHALHLPDKPGGHALAGWICLELRC